MILNIAREMGRPASLTTLDRRGPNSLNLDKRRRELRRIDAENSRMLKRLEGAKASYKAKDHVKSYQKSRQHAAIASSAVERCCYPAGREASRNSRCGTPRQEDL